MKFSKSINEAGIQPVQNQIDADDLSNPALKNILMQIEQVKKRHAKEIENLMKRLEMVKMQNNKQPGTSVPGI